MSADLDVSFEEKMPWSDRLGLIMAAFPSVTQLEWKEVFRIDPSVLGRLVADIQKLENASSGRPGKRPSVNPKDAAQYLRQYENDDYTILPFDQALQVIKGDRSNRHMANLCGVTNTMMFRLLNGEATPTVEVMEQVAKAFRKDPSYFVEYRIAFVLSAMGSRMEQVPEASIVPYLRLKGKYNGRD